MNWKKLLFNWRVLLLTIFIIGSIASLLTYGLTFGLDISGGTAITVKLEHPVDQNTMEQVKVSLEKRLNQLGVKDIKVEPWGDQYIIVKVAGVTEEEARSVKETIERQGVFYAEFEGVIFATGEDIVQVFPIQIEPKGTYYEWSVPFRISKQAAEKFAQLAKDKAGYPVDMFLDPPVNSLFVVPQEGYNLMITDFKGEAPDAMPLTERIKKAFNIDTIAYTNQSIDEIVNLAKDKKLVVLVSVDKNLRDQLEAKGITVRYFEPQQGEDLKSLITRALGLYGPYSLGSGLAQGIPQTDVRITGTAPNQYIAQQEAQVIAVVLSSGSLPVKVYVEGSQYISPELGENFKRQVLIAGIAALIVVGLVIWFHYRKLRIAIPVTFTSLSEVIIILGIAALIKWNLDLPSIAGIIAAIGTGVDQQIVITDELLGRSKREKIVKRSSILKRMGRAFFVILASATTTVVAMSFLFKFFVGGLRGFAFTTILGVIIGISITRPAYAEIAKFLIGEKR
ncbi:preprotein translocase subunit SecD [Thermococcus paralvinellae]|uniref:Protein-export membrane protein SecD n=1 Tax=Thermococcus paralvinellae TaxID=582419 RepID=W0I4Q3_9EURY|nr:preprotein translocase subunit SecD [Thermococcus paralvinellae]AHF81081.1 Protein-export membrane protein SecD [Thermococcus paralvinellae]